MSKTISEVQQAKKELEHKIAHELLMFEVENGVTVSNCYCNSHNETVINNGASTIALGCSKHKVDFSISVRI